MNRIFIEAQNKTTPECNFLKAIIALFFPDKEVSFICIGGVGNLFNEVNLNQMAQAQMLGEQVIVLVDADTVDKGFGFEKRKADIENGMRANKMEFPYFVYPNNQEDGDVETLMASAARRDLHSVFFDCFEDYEKCVSGVKNDCGLPLYNIPNLKGKLHTYMNAQKLSNKLRRKLGAGDRLFHDTNYWDLNVPALQPLKNFLAANLQRG